MSAFGNYMYAQERVATARMGYNYASVLLENRQIHQRLAEIASQTEPVNLLIERDLSERAKLYALAFYVVVGRFPDGLNLGEYELPDKEIAKLIQQVAERTRKECFWSTGDGGCFNARWEDEEVKK